MRIMNPYDREPKGPVHPGSGRRGQPRGVTLLEMLVVVGLLVLIMTILVEIFRNATGALTTQRAMAALDMDLRRVDATIRQDLAGVTAKMRPSNDPRDNRGYFTYGENSFADPQGEDTDDYVAFTAKAPNGKPFSGFMALPINQVRDLTVRPITSTDPLIFHRVPIQSDLAEIIYFLRNGNLYRRVFLIVPPENYTKLFQRSDQFGVQYLSAMAASGWTFATRAGAGPALLVDGTGLYGETVSWLGVNDISARPGRATEIPNPSGNLPTDLPPIFNTLGDLTNRENRAFNPRFTNDFFSPNPSGSPPWVQTPDGIPDDTDGLGASDFYPTLYPDVFSSGLIREPVALPAVVQALRLNPAIHSFPFIYPNSYSKPSPPLPGPWPFGVVHGLESANAVKATSGAGNHAPIDVGDPYHSVSPSGAQSWWGFPTKKETMSVLWTDPIKRLTAPMATFPWGTGEPAGAQSLGLRPAFDFLQGAGTADKRAALPPLTGAYRSLPSSMVGALGFIDGEGGLIDRTAGPATFTVLGSPPMSATKLEIWQALLEDDLLLSNVRSFDVKGLDPVLKLYVDLGYLANPTETQAMPSASLTSTTNANHLGHEGRIPPLVADGRADEQFPLLLPNIGHDTARVVRLRRVWDSWSKDYSQVPAQMLDPRDGALLGPPPYPSYPPPYPVPLQGIQIRVRVVDPTNQRIKLHTIRQDFSDKLN